jgi:hypothetical protein
MYCEVPKAFDVVFVQLLCNRSDLGREWNEVRLEEAYKISGDVLDSKKGCLNIEVNTARLVNTLTS